MTILFSYAAHYSLSECVGCWTRTNKAFQSRFSFATLFRSALLPTANFNLNIAAGKKWQRLRSNTKDRQREKISSKQSNYATTRLFFTPNLHFFLFPDSFFFVVRAHQFFSLSFFSFAFALTHFSCRRLLALFYVCTTYMIFVAHRYCYCIFHFF